MEDEDMEPTGSKEAPPSYTDATKDSRDAPPAYEAIFGMGQMKQEMKQARAASSNQGVFAMKFCEIICNSVALLICLLILATIPVAMIVVGAIYFDDCELQENIPIFLIVFGSVSLVHTITSILKRAFCKKKKEEEEADDRQVQSALNRCTGCFEGFLGIFLFVWFIIGSVWVFSNFDEWQDHKDDTDSSDYCHPVVYLFAFVLLILNYALVALMCCCCCCVFCVVAVLACGD